MTVANENFQKRYTTAGLVNENFPTVFPFFEASDLTFFIDGAKQTLGTNYTVTGGNGAAGTIIFVGTPTAAVEAKIVGRGPTTQELNYQENDSFPAEQHEEGLDRQAIGTQAALRLDTSDPRQYDAGAGDIDASQTRKIVNVTDPTTPQGVATKAFAESLAIPNITIPTPADPADDDEVLTATGGAYITEQPPFKKADLPSAADGAAADVLTATGSGTFDWLPIPTATGATFPFNGIINGDFQVSQRAGTQVHDSTATFPNDDAAFVLDRWILLSNVAAAVDVSKESAAANTPDGAKFSLKLEVTATGAGEKFGIFQILESHVARRLLKDLASSKVSLRFKHKRISALPFNVRVGILSWTGAVDAPTLDPVSAWNVQGTNPTIGGSWNTYENTPANIAVTTAFVDSVDQDITLSNGVTAENIGIFIWVDNTDLVAGDILHLGDIQLEIGTLANTYIPIDPADQLVRCQRFFQKSYDHDTEPGTASITNGQERVRNYSAGSASVTGMVRLMTRMRIIPTPVAFNPNSGGIGTWRDTTAGADRTITIQFVGDSRFEALALSVPTLNTVTGHWTTNAEFT